MAVKKRARVVRKLTRVQQMEWDAAHVVVPALVKKRKAAVPKGPRQELIARGNPLQTVNQQTALLALEHWRDNLLARPRRATPDDRTQVANELLSVLVEAVGWEAVFAGLSGVADNWHRDPRLHSDDAMSNLLGRLASDCIRLTGTGERLDVALDRVNRATDAEYAQEVESGQHDGC